MRTLIKQEENFTTVPNEFLNNENISRKAKSLLIYLYSKPESRDFAINRIKHDWNKWYTAINNWIEELEENWYLIRQKKADGRMLYFMGYEPEKVKDIYQDFFSEKANPWKPQSGRTPSWENQDHNKKNNNKKERNNKKKRKSKSNDLEEQSSKSEKNKSDSGINPVKDSEKKKKNSSEKKEKINALDYLEENYFKLPSRYRIQESEKDPDKIYFIDAIEWLEVKAYWKTEIQILIWIVKYAIEGNRWIYKEKNKTTFYGKNWLEADNIKGTNIEKWFDKYGMKDNIYSRLRLAFQMIDKSFDIYGSPLTNIVDMYYNWQDIYTRAVNEKEMQHKKKKQQNKRKVADYS